MLDFVAAFERGGALLWMLQFTTLRHNPVDAINALVRGCLLEERLGENTFSFAPKSGAPQSVKWTFHNGLGLVFVAVYQKTLSLLYVDELLTTVKDEFVGLYKPGRRGYKQFDETFQRLLREAETRSDVSKRAPTMRSAPAAVAKQNGSSAGQAKNGSAGAQSGSKAGGDTDADDDGAAARRPPAAAAGKGSASEGSAGGEDGDTSAAEDALRAFDVSRLPKGMAGRGRGVRGRAPPAPFGAKPDAAKKKEDTAPKKKARNWNAVSGGKVDVPGRIDYTEDGDGPASDRDLLSGTSASATEDEGAAGARGVGLSRMDVEDEEYDDEDDELEAADLANNSGGGAGAGGRANGGAAAAAPAKRGLLASFVSSIAMNVVGKSALSRADVEPALVEMKRKLMERNVAEEIASQVCDSVGRGLEGQRLAGFTGVASFVRTAFEDALSGILNKRSVDVLLDIKKSQLGQLSASAGASVLLTPRSTVSTCQQLTIMLLANGCPTDTDIYTDEAERYASVPQLKLCGGVDWYAFTRCSMQVEFLVRQPNTTVPVSLAVLPDLVSPTPSNVDIRMDEVGGPEQCTLGRYPCSGSDWNHFNDKCTRFLNVLGSVLVGVGALQLIVSFLLVLCMQYGDHLVRRSPKDRPDGCVAGTAWGLGRWWVQGKAQV
ncbi:Signal recognition particle receptor subunit alpha [Tetrabaena socialis]|uniref:Signal recognition particle receptor subunit alpha n=1 Tax=Tetrabaena socialis TaxID=47790 RepID=A0A2J8AGE7_9CHLO|nr:Signal recognition particle receptor subunit alpha [Tetrabaena socialis]|eukprot:PNH11598.1 Signal recognition particle receptor subunit alpha [Tetrabaena socialis]